MIHNDTEKLIFEQGRAGRVGVDVEGVCLIELDHALPEELRRGPLDGFPEVTEPEMVRHYTRLSQRNVGIDDTFYPLGSCTMKYNPRMNEAVANMKGFTQLHPAMPVKDTQDAFRLLWELEEMLKEICGMDAFTLNPVAGAHGEVTGLKIIRAAIRARGEKRDKVLIPTSAHGTNPASAMLAGFTPVNIEVNPDGSVNFEALEKALDENVAAMMITNPSTLGLFETNIKKIADMLHAKGAFLYCDGANLNALVGIARPGDMGFDVIQTNMHKTFSTPHGGGGPGAGPVGVKKELVPFLPYPQIEKFFSTPGIFIPMTDEHSIGRIHSYYGNFLVLLRAYVYLRTMGARGLREVAEAAVLNANYLRVSLRDIGYRIPFDRPCMHECLIMHDGLPKEIKTLDIAKRLMDKGFHPPTMDFPLHGCFLIEPTETETKETLDAFIKAMYEILIESEVSPELLHDAPHITPVKRVDDVAANRPKNLNLRWNSNKAV
ncbi:MAG: aminomethyl-transferring glycine dehydrogenase subunit GcvPB [Candidatus Paceibacterota bacterium]|jgi:glycine dehydrogenase subunit 2|nr:aminomethyl-transferring glycine dehydrogenase subunit GcvPB [Candidatus Paceibacterota bacterium]